MKRNLLFILLILFVIKYLTFCGEEEPIPPGVTKKTDIPDDRKATSLPVIQGTILKILSPDEVDVVYNITDDGGAKIISRGICWDTCVFPYNPNQTIISGGWDNRTHQSLVLNCLNPGTKYYLRAFAMNNLGTAYGNEVSFTTPALVTSADVFNPGLQYGSVTDIDGNTYKTIQIGTQTWMAENLKTTRYNNGSQVPNVTWWVEWLALKTAAYKWYRDKSNIYKNSFGALYNHYAVNTGNLCPAGWHVPTDMEWQKLEISLGMTSKEASTCNSINFYLEGSEYLGSRGVNQGYHLKATKGWFDVDVLTGNGWDIKTVIGAGDNSSGFSALPAGVYFVESADNVGYSGGFLSSGRFAAWWCSGDPIARALYSEESGISSAHCDEHAGFSVRCLKN